MTCHGGIYDFKDPKRSPWEYPVPCRLNRESKTLVNGQIWPQNIFCLASMALKIRFWMSFGRAWPLQSSSRLLFLLSNLTPPTCFSYFHFLFGLWLCLNLCSSRPPQRTRRTRRRQLDPYTSQDCCGSRDFCTFVDINLGIDLYLPGLRRCPCAEKEKGGAHVSCQATQLQNNYRKQQFLWFLPSGFYMSERPPRGTAYSNYSLSLQCCKNRTFVFSQNYYHSMFWDNGVQ